jgi:hypothetical protein
LVSSASLFGAFLSIDPMLGDIMMIFSVVVLLEILVSFCLVKGVEKVKKEENSITGLSFKFFYRKMPKT